MLILSIFVIFSAGCQNAGQVIETSESPFCTSCKTETITTTIKRLNKKYYKCPQCVQSRAYFGWQAEYPLHVCTKCGKALKKCPICKEQDKL